MVLKININELPFDGAPHWFAVLVLVSGPVLLCALEGAAYASPAKAETMSALMNGPVGVLALLAYTIAVAGMLWAYHGQLTRHARIIEENQQDIARHQQAFDRLPLIEAKLDQLLTLAQGERNDGEEH